MVLKGRAQKVEVDGYLVRSPSLTMRLPAVKEGERTRRSEEHTSELQSH
jgi:hypothetical protein